MNKKQGFIKTIILVVIGIIILSYFGFDLKKIIEADQTQSNLDYFWNLLKNIWDNYIWKGIEYVWENIILVVYDKLNNLWMSGN